VTVVLVTSVLAMAGCSSGSAASGPKVASSTSPSSSPSRSGSPSPTPSPSASPVMHHTWMPLPADTGRILQTELVGPQSGVTMKLWVWLPPQYDQPAYAHTDFPALMLYPGGTGAGRNAWVGTSLQAREAEVAGIRAGTTTPFVFVMPSMQLSPTLDTECADLPGQPKVGTFLADDVRQAVLEDFRLLHDRTAWGAAGTSSGAYCASRLVFDHPDQYAAVVSIGGYFSIETTLAGGHDATVRAGDPASVARTSPPNVSILLWAGSANDEAVARRFLTLVRPPTTAELRLQTGGAHLTVDFARLVPPSLAFLSSKLAHPTPSPA
jgi:Putative esterase